MTAQPQLPALPAGYFWRVVNRTYAIPHVVTPPILVVQIRRKTWLWFSQCVDSMHSVLEHTTYQDEAQHCARILHNKFTAARAQQQQAARVVGDYS